MVIALAVAVASASARIGETLEECQARYGKPVSAAKPGEMVAFYKDDIFLGVSFFEGKADLIIFTKKAGQRTVHFTDEEIEMLLKANGHGQKWSKVPGSALKARWITDDGSVAAESDPEGELTMMTRAHIERSNAVRKSQAEKSLKGF